MTIPPHTKDAIRGVVAKAFAPIHADAKAGATGQKLWASIKEHLDLKQVDDLLYEVLEVVRKEGLLQPCDNVGDRDFGSVTFWNDYVAHGLDPSAPDFAEAKILLTIFHERRFSSIKRGSGLGDHGWATTTTPKARKYIRDMQDYITEFLIDGTVDLSTGGRDLVTCPLTDEKLAIEIRNWKMVVVERRTAVPVAAIYRSEEAPATPMDSSPTTEMKG